MRKMINYYLRYPFQCNKFKNLFDIKKNLFKMIKIGIIKTIK